MPHSMLLKVHACCAAQNGDARVLAAKESGRREAAAVLERRCVCVCVAGGVKSGCGCGCGSGCGCGVCVCVCV